MKNIQEQINRMKSMMGLNEVTNPYRVNWEEPTKEYFIQELDELLGNEMRFSKGEFFHPKNYDLMYSLFPHTFKTIAEHSKGESVETDEEIKEILLNREIQDLMDDWGEFGYILKKDPQAQQEAFRFFNMGNMEVWKGTDPETGEYVDNTDKTFYMGKVGSFMDWNPEYKDTTSSGLIKQFDEPNLKGYQGNLEDYREFAKQCKERSLPAPFVIKLPTNDREGNEYILIGGHKRSTTALQLGVEPIKVWLIDLTK
jgi:Cys-tRNA synthase (O-phospho-L-seryl-tRNA:Cys-tRNA synthase)